MTQAALVGQASLSVIGENNKFMNSISRRNFNLGIPALVISSAWATGADAAIQGLLIRAAGRAIGSFFARTGRRRAASSLAKRSASRGLSRMESSGFKKYRKEFVGGLAHGTGSAIGAEVTSQVISAIRPNKSNGTVYCAAIGTDCDKHSGCAGLQRQYPASGDRYVSGGFLNIDKQVVLFEEANAIGLDWVAAKRKNAGWSNAQIANHYFPLGFVRRDIGRTGAVREQSLQFLTPSGLVRTEERIDYRSGSGHVNLTTYADGGNFDDYFSFSV